MFLDSNLSNRTLRLICETGLVWPVGLVKNVLLLALLTVRVARTNRANRCCCLWATVNWVLNETSQKVGPGGWTEWDINGDGLSEVSKAFAIRALYLTQVPVSFYQAFPTTISLFIFTKIIYYFKYLGFVHLGSWFS